MQRVLNSLTTKSHHYAVPPSESLESPTTIPATQVTPLASQEKDQVNSRLSQSQTLPIGLADAEESEEQENKEKENKVPEAPRKQEPSWETACTLLITLMRLTKHFHQDPMMSPMMMMYSQTLRKLCEMRWKVKERRSGCGSSCCKEAVCQQPLPPWLLRHPSFQLHTPQLPQGPPPGHHPPHQGVVAVNSKEKRTPGKSSRL